jgi:hypothetical protein
MAMEVLAKAEERLKELHVQEERLKVTLDRGCLSKCLHCDQFRATVLGIELAAKACWEALEGVH